MAASSACSLASLAGWSVRMPKTGRPLHLRDHRIERAVLMMRRAEIAQPRCAVRRRSARPDASARRDLPTPGSAEISTTRPLPAFACAQRRSSSSISSSRPTSGVAPDRSASKWLSSIPSPNTCHAGTGDRQTFEFDRAEVLALEQAADLPPGGRVDHHLIRSCEALQACREVRRLTDRRLLARITRANRLADDHQSRCDANADMERLTAHGGRTDRGGNSEAGTHGAFGISLSGFRPAEVDQHPVTHVTRDEAVKLLDSCGDARLVSADDLPQIFGVEPCRECGRADEVAEHHAERAAFGSALTS